MRFERLIPAILYALLLVLSPLAPSAVAQSATVADQAVTGEAEAEPTTPADPLWIAIRNAKRPAEGVLSGGQPTPEQLAEAARAGYRTVVNLRGVGEQTEWDEAAKAAELGLTYVSLPIAGSQDLSADKARRLREILSAEDALPAMVHCASGNRVGALFALNAFHLDGDDVETALRKGAEAGLTKLTEAVRAHLTSAE